MRVDCFNWTLTLRDGSSAASRRTSILQFGGATLFHHLRLLYVLSLELDLLAIPLHRQLLLYLRVVLHLCYVLLLLSKLLGHFAFKSR